MTDAPPTENKGRSLIGFYVGATALVLLVAAVAAVWISHGGKFNTPRGIFRTLQGAARAKDYTHFLNCLTPQSQERVVGRMVFDAVFAIQFAKDTNSRHEAEAAALLKQHGVDPMKALKMNKPSYENLAALIEDKPGFVADFIAVVESRPKDQEYWMSRLTRVTLNEVLSDGDDARGKTVLKTPGGQVEGLIRFKRVAGVWLIDKFSDLREKL